MSQSLHVPYWDLNQLFVSLERDVIVISVKYFLTVTKKKKNNNPQIKF